VSQGEQRVIGADLGIRDDRAHRVRATDGFPIAAAGRRIRTVAA